jgi:hypothetical protein
MSRASCIILGFLYHCGRIVLKVYCSAQFFYPTADLVSHYGPAR